MAGLKEKQGQLVFGLDIGTRSIVGTVGHLSGGKFHVVAQRSKEHETRAMLDGQIHDIGKVGETIAEVKAQLEEDLGLKLSDVCIAAAGRVLRTVTTYVEQTFDNEREITEEDIYGLSTMGVEKAYEEFQKGNDTDVKFYCVGYTPMRYYMNGYQISNLEGHKAKAIAIDLIATFLPDDVVDGLYKAVEIAGLKVANLTLEPIAAIQVAIPEKFRMLNMALVDVGAGTSDICITKEGTITAYGMIPIAGDSLTDILVQHCLVEFEVAEKIKRATCNMEVIEYEDIMGLPQTITTEEVLSLLGPSIENMTKKVADGIKELNGDKPVSAVFVVGGGGMVPGYTENLAKELGIAKERVAIRGKEVMQNIEFEMTNARKDSMMVTPIGICYSYYEQSNNFIFVEFNGVRIKLYDNGKLTIADAAIQSQYPNEDLFPKRGLPLTYTVNGRARMTRGTLGEASIITLNGAPADMYTQIHNGDRVDVTASTAGEPAKQEMGKLPELVQDMHVFVNGTKVTLPRTAEVNGNRENSYYQIQEGDIIEVKNYYTVEEIAKLLDMPLGMDVRINDTPAKPDTRVYENFTVSWKEASEGTAEETAVKESEEVSDEVSYEDYSYEEPEEDVAEEAEEGVAEEAVEEVTKTAEEIAEKAAEVEEEEVEEFVTENPIAEVTDAVEEATVAEPDVEAMEEVTVESVVEAEAKEEPAAKEKAVEDKPSVKEMTADEQKSESDSDEEQVEETEEEPLREVYVIVNHKPITMTGKKGYVYVDVFDYIDFDLRRSNGRRIVTNLNDRPAEYMEPLENGDIIDIYWS